VSALPVSAAISRRTASAFASLRATTTTVKSLLARAIAVALPTPSVPPVIRQIGFCMIAYAGRFAFSAA
jgi:hypothetical protein